jgi:hypothetical protein
VSIVSDAFAAWREVRAEFEDYREAAYERAHEQCNGVLLNARGERAGIDPCSLFIGPQARALAYASEELRDYWQQHPRLTYEAFERSRTADRWAS